MHRLLLESHVGGGGGDGYLRDMNFDANMVIILSALLCALILALGLNSILRCAMRCGFGLSSAASTVAADRPGLKKRELKRFPVAAYGSSGVEIATTECAICLGEFADVSTKGNGGCIELGSQVKRTNMGLIKTLTADDHGRYIMVDTRNRHVHEPDVRHHLLW
ncbi:hypothetical protein HID58_045015 [Brassica napus]|uniref:RING-type E3 ubiquitin transferase n=1 Tax=Brassica napus TaxID=3708 RepID=A0ABQ8AT75_BRANA|nr:hypothetical protein HID58_045015 [Brassica napus]